MTGAVRIRQVHEQDLGRARSRCASTSATVLSLDQRPNRPPGVCETSSVPGRCRCWNLRLAENAEAVYPADRATLKIVGVSKVPRRPRGTSFHSTPWRSGGSPESIDVCEGSVLLGVMVLAVAYSSPPT